MSEEQVGTHHALFHTLRIISSCALLGAVVAGSATILPSFAALATAIDLHAVGAVLGGLTGAVTQIVRHWTVHLLSLIDGGWFDIVTVIVAFALSVFKCIRHRHRFISGETGRNVLHGVAIFPLFMLAISVLSNEALQSLLASNRIILSVAGFVALFSILEDEFEKARVA